MNSITLPRKLALLGLASVGIGLAAMFGPAGSAEAAEPTRSTVGDLQECTISKEAAVIIDSLNFWREDGTAARGGNIEFEWKVEAGDS